MAAGINDTFRQVGVAVGDRRLGRDLPRRRRLEAQELRGHRDRAATKPRELVEATSSGTLHQAVSQLPQQVQGKVQSRGRTGLPARAQRDPPARRPALLRRRGAALWLVRERDIEREGSIEGAPLEAEPEPAGA